MDFQTAIKTLDADVLLRIVMTCSGGSINPNVALSHIQRLKGSDASVTGPFVVFAGDDYYPSGGAHDALAVVYDAGAALQRAVSELANNRWADMLDISTGTVTQVLFELDGRLVITDDRVVPREGGN